MTGGAGRKFLNHKSIEKIEGFYSVLSCIWESRFFPLRTHGGLSEREVTPPITALGSKPKTHATATPLHATDPFVRDIFYATTNAHSLAHSRSRSNSRCRFPNMIWRRIVLVACCASVLF